MNARYVDIWLVFLFKQDQFCLQMICFATSTTSLFIVIAAYSGERTAQSMKSAACVVILSLIISEFQCFVKGGNTGSMISALRFHLCTPFVFI
jgi:hypothetical protein